MEKNKSKSGIWRQINPLVFFASALLVLILTVYTVYDAERTGDFFANLNTWIIDSGSWFYVLAVTIFLVFTIFLGLSRFGTIKLGPDHSEPDYSYLSWFAMLFSAGMGIGLMFFSVAEPVIHYMNPPVGPGETVDAARRAMQITFFHWGLHAWGIYAVIAICLAYFGYRHELPLSIRSALYPLIGDRIYGWMGHLVDTFAVVGTLFGLATSLGIGATQAGTGLEFLFGINNTIHFQIALIAGITLLATISVVSGLDVGIRRLSELNILLAIALLLFVLFAGPTGFLLQTFVQNTGTYISGLFQMTSNLYAYEPSKGPTEWIGGWTIFYWGWWIAWSPFVGTFIARISRGRTIREFVIGVLCVPVGFTFLWMTVFGDTALYMVMIEGMKDLGHAVIADESVALFALLEHLPFAGISSLIGVMLVVTFFVTSSDSGSLVVSMLTSGGANNPPIWQRIFWSFMEGIVAAMLLLAGGLYALQTAAILSALPFAIILLFMCWGLYRALSFESIRDLRTKEAWIMPRGRSWQWRLRTLIRNPNREEVEEFLIEKVRPALEEVAAELKKQKLDTRIAAGPDHRVWLEVLHESEVDFFYEVRPREHERPAFTAAKSGKNRPQTVEGEKTETSAREPTSFHAEIHLKHGSQGYDIMGLSEVDIINDVIDQYERHLAFLKEVRKRNGRSRK